VAEHISDFMPDSILIYTDGACRGNPGPGGWGVVLIWGKKIKELSGGEVRTTNNRMELTAAIRALEALKAKVPIVLHSDSQYVVRGMTEWRAGWKRKGWRRASGALENADLWQRLDSLAEGLTIEWVWIRGHVGTTYNERADRLAVAAIPDGT